MDCGVFAIANATVVAYGVNPETIISIQPLMRKHLMNCFEQAALTQFSVY